MDPRDMQAEFGNWWQSFDEERMVLCVELYSEELESDDHDGMELVEVPARYEVCDLCDGKGHHVNPSIDAHGLTHEDMYDDPDFARDYMRGTYDVACYACGGKRVVPTVDETRTSKDVMERLEAYWRERDDMIRERVAEIRYGY